MWVSAVGLFGSVVGLLYALSTMQHKGSAALGPLPIPALSVPRTLDAFWLVVLTSISLYLRCSNLSHPDHLLFDEVHFGKFVNHHINGTWYYDIHPPLVKLLMALMLTTFTDYTGDQTFISIGQKILPTTPLKAMRLMPALSSAFLVPVVYSTSRGLGVSRWGSVLSSTMLLLDNLVCCEGRMLTTDTTLLLFIALSFHSHVYAERQRMFTLGWYVWNIMCGVWMGCTISTKWTGLSVIGVVGISTVVDLFRRGHLVLLPFDAFRIHIRDFSQRLVMLLAIPISIYVFMFHLWFATCYKMGPEVIHMPRAFLANLEGSTLKAPAGRVYDRPSFWQNFADLNKNMFTGNRDILAPHHWQSMWYSWPLNLRGLNCWYSDYYIGPQSDEGVQQHVYFLGNPLVWWFALFSIPTALYLLFSNKKIQKRKATEDSTKAGSGGRHSKAQKVGGSDGLAATVDSSTLGFNVFKMKLGYWTSILPYILVRRSCFIYHYLPSLFFACLLSGVVSDELLFTMNWSWRYKFYSLASIAGIFAWSFHFFGVLTYGLPVSQEQYEARMWFDTWR